MASHSPEGYLAVRNALSAVSISATTNGLEVDTKGYGYVTFVVNAGILTDGGSATLDIKVQETDVTGFGGTVTDITGATFTQITTANDVAVYVGRVRIDASRDRYMRLVLTEGGTITSALVAAVAVLTEPEGGSANVGETYEFTV